MWLLALLTSAARAHTGAMPVRGRYDWSSLPDAPPGAWNVWEFYPSIVIGCAVLLGGYALMAGPLRRRWELSPEGPTRGEWTLYVSSILLVFFSLQGPLHEISDVYLFSGHMVQHLLITLIFPPLFIRGIPGWMWKPLVSKPLIARIGRGLTHPISAFLIGTGALYLWHIPVMYEWAMVDHEVHITEHLMFMVSAVVMWWPAWSRIEEIPPLSPGWRMIYLFVLTIPMKALGAVITVSDYLLYEYYASQPRLFGFDPLTDQRTGGLIMWVPGGLVFWVTIGIVFFRHYYADIVRTRRGPAVSSAPAQ